ncbi:translation initiation factor, putative [Entamoeba histolytica HM-1:IMSS-B]|uniref:Translation initiation factor, putative n=9 Tax=Entamoeba TaxID=5758 RepID=C4M9X9_ENTH1|nr:protein translation factor SUI1, putative [Entamoeba dispar SAW760]XP_008859954.1 translation initiation factor, putative [Entamoeba nuttalli P19]XP_650999.1 Translation initiation factor, putative [Entamoeba histolytica HM-1:IMSS]EMD43955.1 translation initiation factor, putative [Entamoeba histolytica KU27]EMH74627.1 translation initiation factor, putative [Entamoeba histolytica HM-1:IMSS-B]EMS17630.1 translation initiation factor, putative [Entamoeba histolytica HM-3:IMSS]ENY61199.1 tra|eukprot:EDR25117.1 protein translation factor SUI1, putative [Entamoeba dispar SAW760]
MAESAELITNNDQLVEESTISGKGSFIVHFRIQQRNGRKCVTTITGIPERYDADLILKHFKRTFNCNGSLQKSKDGEVEFKLSGDQRKAASNFFLAEGILLPENIKIHGF